MQLFRLSGIGHIGRVNEMKDVNGHSVINFTVAFDTGYRDKESGEWVENTQWCDASVWSRYAQSLEDRLRVGRKVYVEGQPSARAYASKDNGEPKASLTLRVTLVQFLDKESPSEDGDAPKTRKPRPTGGQEFDPEELPF